MLELALIEKLYEVNGPNTRPQLMLKQCRSRVILSVVIDISFDVKS